MGTDLKNGGLLPSATALISSLNQKQDTSSAATALTSSQKDLLLQGEEEIDEALQEANEVLPFRYSITSYGVDYPVDALVQRIRHGDITIPSFQRGFVWSLREASRFVESLLLGLPVPSIFLSKQEDTQELLVIDGQQRLLTLQYFFEEQWPLTKKRFELKGISAQFEGLSFSGLPSESKRRLSNSVLHAIVVKQDQPSEDSSSIFHIFERLNTSGVSLAPQEIRTAIYHGPLSDLLRNLNENRAWRAIYGKPHRLMRDQELILRFLALLYAAEKYEQPMKGFLNDFMSHYKNLSARRSEEMARAFEYTIEFIHSVIGRNAFKLSRVLNAALFDAIMVGVARRLEAGRIEDTDQFKKHYQLLLEHPLFLAVAGRATANEENVQARLRLATEAFARVA